MFAIILIGSLLSLAIGALMVLAGGMSDAPDAGNASAKAGAVAFVIGLVCLVGSLVAHFGFHVL